MVSDFSILDSEVLKLLPVTRVVLCTSTKLVSRTFPYLPTGTALLVARQQLLYSLPKHYVNTVSSKKESPPLWPCRAVIL